MPISNTPGEHRHDTTGSIEARRTQGAVGVAGAAEYTGTSQSFIRKLIRQKRLAAVRLGRRVVIPVSALEELLIVGTQERGR